MNNFTVFQKTRLPGVSANASLWMVIPGLDAASNRADRLKRRVRTYCKAVYQQNLRQWQFGRRGGFGSQRNFAVKFPQKYTRNACFSRGAGTVVVGAGHEKSAVRH